MGTLINIVTVVVGGVLGTFMGGRLPDSVAQIASGAGDVAVCRALEEVLLRAELRIDAAPVDAGRSRHVGDRDAVEPPLPEQEHRRVFDRIWIEFARPTDCHGISPF